MGFSRKSTRRKFFQDLGLAAGGAALAGGLSLPRSVSAAAVPDIAVAGGTQPKTDPKAIVKKAIETLGGMGKFVAKGDVVVIKPNIGWDRRPEQAANTNPDVVTALVEMALEAGAKDVKVFDNPVANAQASYQRSGIFDAAKNAGADVSYMDKRFFKTTKVGGDFLKAWPVYTPAIECDCLINVPILKHHSMAGLTMSLKNYMGVIGGERGAWHRNLDTALAEFGTFMKPKLTVLDAYRILLRNGPTGGSVRDAQIVQKCIAGTDQVAVDAYGAKLFKETAQNPAFRGGPEQLGYLIKAKQLGVGENDLSKLTIEEVTV